METVVVHTIPVVGGLQLPMQLMLGFAAFLMIRWVIKTLNPAS